MYNNEIIRPQISQMSTYKALYLYTFDKYSTSFNFIYFYQYEDASRLSELVQGVSVPKNTEAQNVKVRKSRQTSSAL